VWPAAVALVAVGVIVGFCARSRPVPAEAPAAESVPAADSTGAAEMTPGTFAGRAVRPGENLAQVLGALGLSAEAAGAAATALAGADFDFQRLMPGDSVTVEFREAAPAGVRYHVDIATSYEVRFGRDSADPAIPTATARRVTAPVETTVIALVGDIRGSLWQSLLDAGADERLAAAYTSILRHQLPALRDMHPGDSFQLVVERLAVGDSAYGFGRIHALRFRGGVDVWGFHHARPDGLAFYCDADGRSLGPVLSYPPVVGARRTSDFGPRLHPVVRRRVQHNGLDFEAPHGTPVRAVADGVVSRASWRRGYGRTVEVEHAAAGLTRYSHLSRYAEGIRSGAAVGRGDLVGYVGSTGLSSGAHLDFGTLRDGRHVDPLGVLPARFEQVEPGERDEFERFVAACRSAIARAPAP
jgi:murein DD-endopeptidase MepM/ murein hydrolase activator NlpD